MPVAVTSVQQFATPQNTTRPTLVNGSASEPRKDCENLVQAKPNSPKSIVAGAFVIAIAAVGILVVSNQGPGRDATDIVVHKAASAAVLLPPANSVHSLAMATNNIVRSDSRPVNDHLVGFSTSKKIVELMPPIRISEVQRLLAKLDFRPGPPDGVIGHRTVKAIRLYQKFGGLEITGHATLDLLADLRAVADRMPEPTS